jgi:hypothetical protein
MYTNNLTWPTKEPDEVLDFQIDATSKIADSADTIISASVAVAPSGPGEMIPMQITVAGSFITVWLSGGIPARVCQVKVQVTTAAGRTYEWPIVIQISADLAVYPIAPPASQGFGPLVAWYA